MKSTRVRAVCKFGQKDHIQKFVDGQLYMNTLRHFTGVEDGMLRGDPDEGVHSWIQPNIGKLSIQRGEEVVPISRIAGPISFRDDVDLARNIFCMVAIHGKPSDPPIDPRNFEFGETFALLSNGNEFLRRVSARAQAGGLALDYNLVEYVDRSTHHGKMGPFRKNAAFSYQSEFRLVLPPGTGEVQTLEIGSIADIVRVGPSREINDLLKSV